MLTISLNVVRYSYSVITAKYYYIFQFERVTRMACDSVVIHMMLGVTVLFNSQVVSMAQNKQIKYLFA